MEYQIPTFEYLVRELEDHQKWLRTEFNREELVGHDPGEEAPGTEVRLQVTETFWNLQLGDPQFDLDHSGLWGSSFLPYDDDPPLCSVAQDLIEQVLMQIPEEEDN